MNRRIARKVRKAWQADFHLWSKVEAYRDQKKNPAYYEGLLTPLYELSGSKEPFTPKLDITPKEFRQLRRRRKIDRGLLVGAYRSLPKAERTEWAVEFHLARTQMKYSAMTIEERTQAILDGTTSFATALLHHVADSFAG